MEEHIHELKISFWKSKGMLLSLMQGGGRVAGAKDQQPHLGSDMSQSSWVRAPVPLGRCDQRRRPYEDENYTLSRYHRIQQRLDPREPGKISV